MRIYIKEINTDIPFNANSHLLPYVGPERLEKIERINNDRLKNLNLFSELTMIEEASKDLSVPKEKIKVLKTKEGKPYIEGFPDYHISISHCDGIIAFASDSSPIGIDIEGKRRKFELISKRFFTPHEYKKIIDSKMPEDEFLMVWTRKEAYVKLTGTGLKTPLDSFDVYDTSPETCTYNTREYISLRTGGKYICSVAYNTSNTI